MPVVTTPQTLETSVLIVGGGPVGLALASDLGARGVACLLVEQNESTTDHAELQRVEWPQVCNCCATCVK